MHFARAVATLAALGVAHAASTSPTLTHTQLVSALLPPLPSDTTTNDTLSNSDFSNIFGQTVVLKPFEVTILTNTSHALISVNVSRAVSDIGYLAVGFGTTMVDSSMVILWPLDDAGEAWMLSARSATGYHQPTVSATFSSTQPSALNVLPNLFDMWTLSGHSYTVVSFLRPLILQDSEMPFDHFGKFNLSREIQQDIIYAFSPYRPDGADAGAHIDQHEAGMFGSTKVDLSQPFLDAADGDTKEVEAVQGWTKYDVVVFAHAGVGMLTFLLIAPAGVLIARLGRNWHSWFTWHASVQGLVTLPASLVTLALGLYVSSLTSNPFSAHKLFGLLLPLLLLILVAFGYWSHKQPHEKGTPRPWWRVVHILGGLGVLVLGWIQIWLGFGEYTGRPRGRAVGIVYAVFIILFLLPYLTSVGVFVFARRREGRSWRFALMGLGNDKASATQKPWVGRLAPWMGTGEGDESDAKSLDVSANLGLDERGGHTGAQGDLSAWR